MLKFIGSICQLGKQDNVSTLKFPYIRCIRFIRGQKRLLTGQRPSMDYAD